MAHMIPLYIAPDTKSPGEVEVFERLKNDPATEEWIVLHSLDIAEHHTQLAGEIDFVAIVPGQGILCIEVKGCRSLRRERGWWFYGANSEPDKRGPFRQASNAMYSVRDYLFMRDERLRRLLYWSAVIFPFVDIDEKSAEWHSWQLIDRRWFDETPLSGNLIKVLECAHDLAAQRGWYQSDLARPTVATSRLAANFLRPEFEVFESPAARAKRRATEIKRYTEEQFGALDAMENNERVIFTGPAGTGKTLLAIEAARRGAVNGSSVLFLCFNRLLGSWLKAQMADLPQVTVSTLHSHMLAIAGGKPPEQATHAYWSSSLPEQASYALLDGLSGEEELYDLLVIDEAQDILAPAYLDFLELSLDGGLESGRWLLFGDFEMQMIYGQQARSIYNLLEDRLRHAPRYALRNNCRNTPRIAETIRLLGQMNPGYKRILRPDNNVEPKIRTYSTDNQQRKLLIKSLEELLKEGVAPEDIVILTSHGGDTFVPSLLGEAWHDRLVPLSQSSRTRQEVNGCIRHGTIYYFKGMEAPAVVVAGMDDVTTEKGTSLLYIALSRALHRLVVLLSEDLRRELLATLISQSEGVNNG